MSTPDAPSGLSATPTLTKQEGEGQTAFSIRCIQHDAWTEGHDAACPWVVLTSQYRSLGRCTAHQSPYGDEVAAKVLAGMSEEEALTGVTQEQAAEAIGLFANGHRWPCPGFYTGNHNQALRSWACTCGEEESHG